MYRLLSVLCLGYLSFTRAFDEISTIALCAGNKSANDVYLDLSSMELPSITKPFVSGPITCINLAENRIESLRGAFDYLTDLRHLDLTGNPILLEDLASMNVSTLRTLVLDRLENNPNTRQISTTDRYGEYVYDEDYRSYTPEPFTTGRRFHAVFPTFVPHLEKLSLRNFWRESEAGAWLQHFDAPALSHLYIAGNALTNDARLPNFVQNLTHLNIDDNKMKSLSRDFPKLRYLSMDRNEVEIICGNYCDEGSLRIRNISALEYLSLGANKISTVEPNAFADFHDLKLLNLARNQIEYLPRHIFENTGKLETLSLGENSFGEVPDVCGLKELRSLELGGNKIRVIDETAFCDLSNLRSIDLSRNGLTTVSEGSFRQLPGLKNLDLSSNKIRVLPEDWLGPGPCSLSSLNLDRNEFRDITDMSLNRIKQLGIINIGHNPLRTVTIGALNNLPPEMKINVTGDCLQFHD